MPDTNDQGHAHSFALDGVVKVHRPNGRDKFICSISAATVRELMAAGKIEPLRTVALDESRMNDMVERILDNIWHGGALTWNARPGKVEVEYDEAERRLYILNGKPTIPDSYQRHEGIKKAVERANLLKLPFEPEQYEIPLVIERLDADGERALNIEYNPVTSHATNRTRRKSSRLMVYPNQMVNRIMETEADAEQPIFKQANVELATDNLSRSSYRVATFSTLARGIDLGFPDLDEHNFEQIADFILAFLPCLSTALPQLRLMSRKDRGILRAESIVDAGVMIQAYFRLAGHLWTEDIPDWEARVVKLGQPCEEFPDGNLMSRKNPLWKRKGVLVPNKKGDMVLAKGHSSSEAVFQALLHIAELN